MMVNNRIRLIILVVCWLVVVSLFRDLKQVQRGFERENQTNSRYQVQLQKNQELKAKLEEVQSDYFKEKVAREKLNMQKPGETVVVLPERTRILGDNTSKKDSENKSNWEKWWDLVR